MARANRENAAFADSDVAPEVVISALLHLTPNRVPQSPSGSKVAASSALAVDPE
jgi:hypothetical protein